jgi:hypothetical protein
MRYVSSPVFKIAELREQSESAFKRAHEKWASEIDSECFSGSVFDDFFRVARHLGFDVTENNISFSGFWSQGDGASFGGQYCLSGYGLGPIADYAPRDAELIRIEQSVKKSRAVFYKRLIQAIPCEYMAGIRSMFTNRLACAYVVISRSHSRYSHEMTMQSDEGENVREDVLYRLGDNIEFCDESAIDFACEEFAENILEDARSLAQWLYSALEREYEYQTSEECFIDSCDANEYEFDESGNAV